MIWIANRFDTKYSNFFMIIVIDIEKFLKIVMKFLIKTICWTIILSIWKMSNRRDKMLNWKKFFIVVCRFTNFFICRRLMISLYLFLFSISSSKLLSFVTFYLRFRNFDLIACLTRYFFRTIAFWFQSLMLFY